MASLGLQERVVSREEVDALLGFELPPGPPPGAGRDGTVLTPGQRVALHLELPVPPGRARAARRAAPRPLDAWPQAKLRPAAVAAWLRRPAADRASEPVGTDFWPAYADVLSNVVLNLLFLVGTLTLGLVVLNQQVVGFQKRLSELEAQGLLAPRRPEQAAPAASTSARVAVEPAIPPRPAAVEAAATAASAALPPSPPPTAGGAPAVAANTARQAQREFAMRSDTAPLPGGPAAGSAATATERRQVAEALAQNVVGGRHAATLVFDLRETRWPRSRPIVGAEQLTPDERRALVAFAPSANRRLMAEAFSRLASVREAMIASGVPAGRIDLRIAPVPPELENDESVSGSVYVINLGGS